MQHKTQDPPSHHEGGGVVLGQNEKHAHFPLTPFLWGASHPPIETLDCPRSLQYVSLYYRPRRTSFTCLTQE